MIYEMFLNICYLDEVYTINIEENLYKENHEHCQLPVLGTFAKFR